MRYYVGYIWEGNFKPKKIYIKSEEDIICRIYYIADSTNFLIVTPQYNNTLPTNASCTELKDIENLFGDPRCDSPKLVEISFDCSNDKTYKYFSYNTHNLAKGDYIQFRKDTVAKIIAIRDCYTSDFKDVRRILQEDEIKSTKENKNLSETYRAIIWDKKLDSFPNYLDVKFDYAEKIELNCFYETKDYYIYPFQTSACVSNTILSAKRISSPKMAGIRFGKNGRFYYYLIDTREKEGYVGKKLLNGGTIIEIKPTDITELKENILISRKFISNSIIEERKNENMNMNKIFGNLKFGQITDGSVDLSIKGIALKSADGGYVVYDTNNNDSTIVTGMTFDSDMIYAIPTPVNQIKQNDIIFNDSVPVVVKNILDNGEIEVYHPQANAIIKILPKKTLFGINMVSRVFNPFGDFKFDTDNNTFNPMMMLMFANDNSNDMMKMMFMSQMFGGDGQMNNFNPFAMMMLMNKSEGRVSF